MKLGQVFSPLSFALFSADLASGSTPLALQKCTSYRQRYDIHSYSPEEIDSLIQGIKHLYESRKWHQLAQKHHQLSKSIHGCSQFLPFHALFLWEMETMLMEFNRNITIPHWNWTHVSQNPLGDRILSDAFFGDKPSQRLCNSLEMSPCCVASGNFNGWKLDSQNCLSRNYSQSSGGYYPWRFFLPVLHSSEFTFMTERLEQLHANMHSWVGGSMKTYFSPFDPLFYLHHSFIDKVWHDWKRDNVNKYGGKNCDNSPARASDIISGYNVSVQFSLNNDIGLCVQYIAARTRNASPPNFIHNQSIANITLGVELLQKNGFNKSQIDRFLADVQTQKNNINTEIKDAIRNNTPVSNNTKGGVIYIPEVGTILTGSSSSSNPCHFTFCLQYIAFVHLFFYL
jgi:Common central domain of tyrosinase